MNLKSLMMKNKKRMNPELNISNNNIRISDNINGINVFKNINTDYFSFKIYASDEIFVYDEKIDLFIENINFVKNNMCDVKNNLLNIDFELTDRGIWINHHREFDECRSINISLSNVSILIYLINILKKIIDNKPFKEVIK